MASQEAALPETASAAAPSAADDNKRAAVDDVEDSAHRKRSRWGAHEAGTTAPASAAPAIGSAPQPAIGSVPPQPAIGSGASAALQANQFLTGLQQPAINAAYQMQAAAVGLLPASAVAPQGNASGLVANRAQSRQDMESRDSKRLFVGNLPPGLLAHELHAVFTPLGALGAEIPSAGKSFGFVQFPQEAQALAAMQAMDGFDLAGRRLRVSRPHNSRLVQQQQVQQHQQYAMQQQQMLAAYGMQQQQVAHPYAAQAYAAQTAMQHNLFAAATRPAAPTGLPAALSAALPAALPGAPSLVSPAPPALPAAVSQPLASTQPAGATGTSRMLLLKNLVSAAEVDDELPGEVRAECSKFGNITDVEIKTDDGSKQVEVRVTFATAAEADIAQKAMHQRWFGGRVVVAELAPS